MNEDIQKNWEEEKVIGLDCILKCDGTVIILNCYHIKDESKISHYAFPLCKTTVKSLEEYNDDVWSYTDTFVRAIVPSTSDVILGGEGGMGNEGFLAYTDKNGEIKWSCFFTNSNPFHKIEVNGNKIWAYTSSDLKYEIDMESPEHIKIIHEKWRG